MIAFALAVAFIIVAFAAFCFVMTFVKTKP